MSNLLISDEELSNSPSSEVGPVPLHADASATDTKEMLNISHKQESTRQEVPKVSIRFQPIGAAPLIKPQFFQVSRTQTVGSIMKFLMRRLRLKSIHVYVLSSFQPTPDETLGPLHDLFKTKNELILSYCEQIAYG